MSKNRRQEKEKITCYEDEHRSYTKVWQDYAVLYDTLLILIPKSSPCPFPLLIPSASYLEMPFHCNSIFRLLPLYYGYTWEVHIMPRGKRKKIFNKINQKFILSSIQNKHTHKQKHVHCKNPDKYQLKC